MPIISFIRPIKQDIVYCVIDNTHEYRTEWTRELIKNQADFTITNIISKEYDVYQSQSEDAVLKHVTDLGYKYAVVISTGTEFINGDNFFKNVAILTTTDFFVAGHILDRGDAYYELHHQCYVINLEKFKNYNYPLIGKQELGSKHKEEKPWRSKDNWHDDYTPKWVSGGDDTQEYQHKCHGWNILRIAFDADEPVVVFNETIRDNKKHFYPENQEEFLKLVPWAYRRELYCSNEFVHTATTDSIPTVARNIKQVFTPASGTLWLDTIHPTEPVTVVMYDYNQQALDYWKDNVPAISNVTYKFIKLDLLHDNVNLTEILDTYINETFINLSNIFAYEGTMFFTSLEYRLSRENKILSHIKETIPAAFIYFTIRAAKGYVDLQSKFYAKDFQPITIGQLTRPTWHGAEWI